MRISYNVLKNYIPQIKKVDELAHDIIMHTAEVEGIYKVGMNLEKVFVGEVLETKKHPDSEKLNICKVKVLGEEKQIVCGAQNVRAGLKVAVATVGRELAPNFIIQKSKIRGEISEGMICSLDELGLTEERQDGIWEMPNDAIVDTCLRDYLKKDDFILEIDNKAINHRVDMFSYIGIIREINTISGNQTNINYEVLDLSNIQKIDIKVTSPFVGRYMLTKIEGVKNIKSNELIQNIISRAGHESKGLLIDLSNYSLYFYGQPTHIFDADKIVGDITVRQAKNGEKLLALNNIEYTLNEKDIVIADSEKVIAIAGIIGGKNSCVDENTKNIYIERAHFDQAVLRFTGKRLGVRTDSLNIFEKDTIKDMCQYANSLIIKELQKYFPDCKIVGTSDYYPNPQNETKIEFDLNHINSLIGANYSIETVKNIFSNLGINLKNNIATIPFWRKDLTNISDLAEEIARIDGYDKIQPTIPKINLGAIMQDNIYKLKNDLKSYFTSIGFYDTYNYTFVNEKLYNNLGIDINNCVKLKNSLSEEQTHLRDSLIPNMLLGVKENIKSIKNIKLIEIEKVFFKDKENNISEKYLLSGVITKNTDIIYYELQQIISNIFKKVFSQNFYFDTCSNVKTYYHAGRVADIIMGGKKIGVIGEIHPIIAKKFDINDRVGFFEIDLDELSKKVYNIKKAQELSPFQENNFDLSFVVDKNIKGKDIALAIAGTDKKNIKEVEIFDIYEDENKLPGKRSISFKIYIQSLNETLSDEFKNNLIKDIITKVEKKGGFLR